MLEKITNQFLKIKNKLTGSTLNEKNIQSIIQDIKLALLEADVHYEVVNTLIEEIKNEALGQKTFKDLNTSESFFKIVYQKMMKIMGEKNPDFKIKENELNKILFIGLQGAGKTTTVAKLALFLQKEYPSKKILLCSTDIYRPMAQEQLNILAEKIKVSFFKTEEKDPYKIAKNALKEAQKNNYSFLFIDTAGRLDIDKKLMDELKELKKISQPDHTIFVVDAMAGQNVFKIFKEFNHILNIDSLILSKFDSDAQGGIAFSVKYILQKAIQFVGTGEKLENLDRFYPERFVKRILGYGDIETLVEKIEKSISLEENENLNEKLMTNTFTLDDYLSQIKNIKKLGKISSLMSMIPLPSNMASKNIDDKALIYQEAIILSMTKRERKNHLLLNNISRKKRIAKGCGKSIQDVTKLINQFLKIQKMFKKLKSNPSLLKKLNIFS